MISAAFGPLSLRLGDVIEPDELGRVVRTWTLGDAVGALWGTFFTALSFLTTTGFEARAWQVHPEEACAELLFFNGL